MSRRKRFNFRAITERLKSPRTRWVCLAAAVILGGVAIPLLTLSGCESQPAPIPTSGAPVASINSEPMVRVRIVRGAISVDVHHASGVQIAPAGGGAQPRAMAGPLRVSHDGNRFVLAPQAGQALAWNLSAVRLSAINGTDININGQSYPGHVILYPVPGSQSAGLSIDAVNHLPMETYLPGVLARELYASWELEAFRAQAIAARSYAITGLASSRNRHYDLESTQASQAYIGVTNNPKALAATQQTRGIVLTTGPSVLTAYYSSSCGGTGQDASMIFPNQPALAPLRGVQCGSWCKESTHYRWQTVRDRELLSKRIAAWGKSRNHAVGGLRMIQEIKPLAANHLRRPVRFEIVDAYGASFNLGAEELRFACNHNDPSLPALDGNQIVRSSHIVVAVTARSVTIHGAGHGHGVGGCQYGFQAMARQGYQAPGILAFYYPGAELRRAYP